MRSTFGRLVSYCQFCGLRPRLSLTRTCPRYTMLVGKPPFQMKDVKAIYQ